MNTSTRSRPLMVVHPLMVGASLLGCVALVGLAGPATGAARTQDDAGERYVRAGAGAVVRTYQDDMGNPIAQLAEGDLLRVHGESVGFLSVTSPRGFPVWVYGEFLERTRTEGVLRVTGNSVLMRPMPDSSVSSYPLRPSKLMLGDRVLFIERNDPSRTMGTDWVKVYSPPTARAWIRATDTTPETDLGLARGEWDRELRRLPAPLPGEGEARTVPKAGEADARTPKTGTPKTGTPKTGTPGEDGAAPAANAARTVPDEAWRSLAWGETLLNRAVGKGKLATEDDFAPAIRAFNVVLNMVPPGSDVSHTAQDRLERAEAHASLAATRGAVADAERARLAKLRELDLEREKQALRKTVHMGRFSGRGWVEPVTYGGERRWFLRWAGEIVFEITCPTGRYDLDLFEGYEIGVRASVVRDATLANPDSPGQVALLDVTRIEVISASVR